MRVRLKLAWQAWPKGHVFEDMPAGQAQIMVARGYAEYFAPAPSSINRMMRPSKQARTIPKQSRAEHAT